MNKALLKGFAIKYMDFIGKHRYLLLFLSLLSFFSLIDIPVSPRFQMTEEYQKFYLFVVSVFKGLFILTCMYPLFKSRLGRVTIWILTSLYAILSLVNAVSFSYYGIGITRKLILIFAQTNSAEVSGFIPGLTNNLLLLLFSPKFYVTLLILGIVFYIIKKLSARWVSTIFIGIGTIGFIAFSVFCIKFTSGRSAHLLSARIVKYGKEVWESNREYEELLKNKAELPHKDTVKSNHLAPVVVVVIGESAHRRHHSLYGYPLPTTPRMDSLVDSLIVFSNVIGSSISTAGNMERILSFKKDDTTCGDGLKYPLLVDLFNEMDYKTYWLSNQERTGTVSNTSGVMTMNADVINYVGADNSEDALLMRYDEVLLPVFKRALAETDPYKLVFLHLLGSHVEYNTRYPDSFEYFTAKKEIETFNFKWLDENMAQRRAEYDNSIRYTDYILGEVLEEVKGLNIPAIFIYFSDHGEEVYDFNASCGRNINTVQVPFFIYANSQYSSSNPELIKRLQENKDKTLSTANFVHLLITLTGGGYAGYEPELDILSDSYREHPRYIDEEIWLYDKK